MPQVIAVPRGVGLPDAASRAFGKAENSPGPFPVVRGGARSETWLGWARENCL